MAKAETDLSLEGGPSGHPTHGPMAQNVAPSIAYWGRGYETYVIIVLATVQTLSFLDRSVINILSEPIKREFQISDAQLGLLNGLAFAVFYCTLGIPIARLAEKTNRSFVIAGSIGIWSLATMSASIVRGFAQLALSRVVVGVGEAGSTPAAHSLISEVVPRERRAMALAIFSAGVPIGSLVGIALGASLADAFGWRQAFFWAGAPGLVVGLIVALTIIEPRKKTQLVHSQTSRAPPFRQALKEVMAGRVFCLMALGTGIVTINSYARLAFMPSFYLRNHLHQLDEMASWLSAATGHTFGGFTFLGLILGVGYGFGGIFGTLFGGWLSDRVARKDVRGYVTVPMWTTLAVIPLGVGSLIVPSALVSLALATLTSFFMHCSLGPVYASVQSTMKAHNRATAAAVFLFIVNILGLAIGSPLVGGLSDFLASMGAGSGNGLRYALIISQISAVFGTLLYFIASFSIKKEFVG